MARIRKPYHWIDEQGKRHDYPSQYAAAKALGVHDTTIVFAVNNGIHSQADMKRAGRPKSLFVKSAKAAKFAAILKGKS